MDRYVVKWLSNEHVFPNRYAGRRWALNKAIAFAETLKGNGPVLIEHQEGREISSGVVEWTTVASGSLSDDQIDELWHR